LGDGGTSEITRVGLKPRRSALLRRRAVLAVVVLAVVVAWIKLHANEISFGQGLDGRRVRQSLESAFQSGKKLVRQGDWDQALVTFERIRGKAPDFPGLQQYIDRGAREARNQALLAGARAALEKSELGPAVEALARVEPDTQLQFQLEAVRDLLRRSVALRMVEAQAAFRDRDYPRALEAVADVLKAVPDDPAALSLAHQAGRAAKARPKPSTHAPSPAEGAAARFRAGDLKGAITAAEKCAARHLEPCRRFHQQLEQFAELHGRVEHLELGDLERLLELATRVGGGRPSPLASAAMARAAALYYNQASDAKTAGQWARAVDLATKAQRLAPAHPGALAIVGELRARAKELFVFAYSLKDSAPDEAIVRLKEVIALTRTEDETHRKAVRWVGKLSR
jgi:tetratricopeptide (TPR) repeat protein